MKFQDIILTLQQFWAKRGCLVVQPYNSEVGAGTFNPNTFLRCLGPEPWNVGYVEPSYRAADGRYRLERGHDAAKDQSYVVHMLDQSRLARTLFPVGRLDKDSTGLLLLTNDGELAARVTHPRYGVVREYLVKIRGELTADEQAKLMHGTTVEGRRVRPRSVSRASPRRWHTP